MASADPVPERAVSLLRYLDGIRQLKEIPVRDIAEYNDKRWWTGDMPDHPSCLVTQGGAGPWLRVAKAQVPQRADRPSRERAAQAQQAVKARALYDDLFDLRLRLQRDSALVELVWGHAVLSWTVSGARVVHPLVTTPVELGFDVKTGTITVTPEAFAVHEMDIDLLQGLKLKGFDVLMDIREEFKAAPVGPFDPAAQELYQRILTPLGQDGQVLDARRPAPPGADPKITTCWVLMVRRRSTMYRRFFGELREALENGKVDVPAPLIAVVADEPGKLDRTAAVGGTRDGERRLLMPLPANPEQEAVARRLASHHGVTVQGPPGTGKTHTIANLISHLVGHGQRVLVTSQKEQALSVLRDKIPAPLRDLSVAVLGSSAAALGQLEQSTQAIYENAVGLDRDAARTRVNTLQAQLSTVEREIERLRDRIAASIARERDERYNVAGAELSPSSVARWLADHQAALGYIPDALPAGPPFPLTAAETADLFRLAASIAVADRAAARLRLPNADDLASAEVLIAVKSELRRLRSRLAGTNGTVQDWGAFTRLSPDGVDALVNAIEQAARRVSQLEQPWLRQVRRELRNDRFSPGWREQLRAANAGIAELAAARNQLSGHDVRLPVGDGLPKRELIDQLRTMRDQLAAGRSISKTFTKRLSQLRDSCLVDLEPPRTAAEADLCLAQARLPWQRYELVHRWNDAMGRVHGPRIDPGASEPEHELAGHADALGAAIGWETEAWETLQVKLRSAGVRPPLYPASADLAALADTLRIASLHAREKDLSGQLDLVRESLAEGVAQPQASRLWHDLLSAFTGNRWRDWDRLVGEARRLSGLLPEVTRFDRLAARVAAEAPQWAARLAGAGELAGTGAADTAAQAWAWRQAETWLRAIIESDDPAALQDQLESKLELASAITSDLAAESAWLGLSERLTDADRRALTAWTQAMRRVGKGTGKYAPRFRAEAQQAMRDAQAAVPVWIMPTHRVVESFDPLTTRFDVVIVDESSQCDLFGLAALSVADRAVIVGDDKQISPQAIGTDESAVHELQEQHLSEIPKYRLLDVKTSLYDLAKMRFPGVIMLREHFRCLPDIIDFSNRLFYNGQILPLREQPADQSWPSVVDVPVTGGFRDPGTDTNEAEAGFIVSKIAELCRDPRYDGLSFGVISLLGDEQAGLIQGRLVERLGEKEVEHRRIRCGNAYHFQGDERHVIFLSMVVTGGEGRRIGVMNKEADRQRINVAASRAQDQLWCVRSIGADELHPEDVRGQLIRHCQHPARVRQAAAGKAASFGSDFERDVYRQIVDRGYLVTTQFRVGHYEIDLVVEGKQARLAIELDGDAYHGSDHAAADQRRQTILERLGWTFHRIRGSAYYRDPDGALSGLWDRLQSLDIQPLP